MEAIATLHGAKELVEELKKLGHDFARSEHIAKGLGSGARRLRDEIRRAAPKGKYAGSGGFSLLERPGQLPLLVKDAKKGGALRKGIVAFSRKQHGVPFSFVESRAPHAWLVEHGASRGQVIRAGSRRGKVTGKKALRFKVPGLKGFLFRGEVLLGRLPATPYFRPTIDRTRSDVEMFLNAMVLDALAIHANGYVRMK